jgi:hypothetical protein
MRNTSVPMESTWASACSGAGLLQKIAKPAAAAASTRPPPIAMAAD